MLGCVFGRRDCDGHTAHGVCRFGGGVECCALGLAGFIGAAFARSAGSHRRMFGHRIHPRLQVIPI